MNRKLLTLTLSLLLGLAAVAAIVAGMTLNGPVQVVLAQADLVNLDTPYTQNFNTLAISGTNLPWTNNMTLIGWYSNRTTYNASDGSSTTGALYSFGSTGSSERALGSIASGTTLTIYYGIRLRNNTNFAITALDVAYTGEQWRQGGNTNQQALAFAYRVGDTVDDLTSGTWTSVPALDFVSPITNSGAITGALNGNDPANRRELSATINVLILPGQEIMLRWMDINDIGNDHALAVDDLSVTPRSSPVLRIAKGVTPTADVEYHGLVTYTVHLANIGGVSDTVLFTDTLPAEVDFGQWLERPEGATVNNDVITWSGTIAAGTAITFSFTAQHVGNYGDVVTNTAEFRGTSESGTAQAVFRVERAFVDVTFFYHDLEDVVLSGETVCLRGDFNGWNCAPMNADAGNTVFSLTVSGLEVGQTYQYKYYVNSAALGDNSRWDMLNTYNRGLTVTSGVDTVHDYRNVVVGWANLQWPHTLQTDLNKPTDAVYGRVYIQNVTNPSGAGRGIKAEVGYGTGPNPATWTWFPMTYNPECEDCGNNDEFMGVMTPTAAGVFSYATRFDGNWGPGNPNAGWTYGDLDGVHPTEPFELDQCGVLTVLAPSLTVAKSVVPDADVPLGGVVTYTVVLSNSGAGEALGVVLTDVLPSEVTFGGWFQQPSGAVYENGVITWTGTVAGNTEVRLVFTATVKEDYNLYGQTVTNTARFTSDNAGSGQASVAFTIVGAPALTIAKSVVPTADVRPGGAVTYTVVLSNSGAGDALGVVLTDALPSEVTFGGWLQQPSGATYENGVITWTGTVAGGAEVRLVFTATVKEDYSLYGQTVTNTARFTSTNAGSGEDSATFTVIGAPTLTIDKSVVPTADVRPGGAVTYTVVLSNSGAGDALGVVLTDVLPSEVTFGGWLQQPSGATYENGVITWTGTVAGNTEVRLVFTATLGSDPGLYNRTVANTASFVSTNAGSGSATATFTTERRYWIYLPLVMRNARP